MPSRLNTLKLPGSHSIGFRMAVTNFVLVCVVLSALMAGVAFGVKRAIMHNAEQTISGGVVALRNFIEASDKELHARMQSMMGRLARKLDGDIVLEQMGGQTLLYLNYVPLNHAQDLMDGVSGAVDGGVSTILARHGDGFLRIASSLTDEEGASAVGTMLDPTSPAHAALMDGREFLGIAHIFGQKYMTYYRPLKNSQGDIVGAAFVGQMLRAFQEALQHAIRQLKVGDTGYYYVFRGGDDPQRGDFVVHPVQANEGKNVLTVASAAGSDFAHEMLRNRQGIMYYEWSNPGESHSRRKIAAYDFYEPWGWLFAASTYEDELTREASRMIWLFSGMGLVAVLALSGIWMYLMGRLVVRPLREANRVAHAVARGDLTVRAEVSSSDEIGQLLETMNQTAESLSGVVSTVRSRAESVATTSNGIAQGNRDLSSRTESQAQALQETATAMEELGRTVAHNADNARDADALSQDARRVVVEGGEAVREAVQSMQGIDASSKRIADIIGVIDGIAFQTNILALNAAVEAARAGEHGRGFAVVASEVRSLAGRSAEAAKEIKQLINDSVAEIEQGNVRAARAGETMEQAVAEIQKVSALISGISTASEQQSQGVSQSAEAVAKMEQSTQQNAAMVEEIAVSAQTMRQQADELVQAVSIFRLASHHMTRVHQTGHQASHVAQVGHTLSSATSLSSVNDRAVGMTAVRAQTLSTPAELDKPLGSKLPQPTAGAAMAKSTAVASPPAPTPRTVLPPVAPATGNNDDWDSF